MMIKWLEDAVHDLQELRHYIAQDNTLAANRVAKQILTAINLLSEQPGIGRLGRVHETRELVIPGTPYIVPYRVKNNSIEILRIFHGAVQSPEEL
jgi:toxin ParE1/3/4